VQDDLFPVFAQWAVKFSLEQARVRFRSLPPEHRLDQQLQQTNQTAWVNLTTLQRDFYAPATQPAAILGQDGKVALIVVKKNKAVLTKLNKWLEDAVKQHALNDLPTLIVDDEADQASVATRTINPLILSIIGQLPQCTYVGYTATPFANILIDPSGKDLYPSNFILNLPRPDGYFGTERIFGREVVEGDEASGPELDGYNMVRIIDDDEVERLGPVGKKAAADFEPEITESLRDATRWFWLATAARRARGDFGHSTMLVHTSVKIAVHESYRIPLINLRDEMIQSLEAGDNATFGELQTLWNTERALVPAELFPRLAPLTFEDVLAELPEVVANTKIILDNCKSDDRLNYSTSGQIAIAVGGSTLSRGLTLEGLVVSFFVRSAGAYDTLLQMARWFGFRPGYEDLPRIWMTDQLRSWFRHLATVEHEIRLDIDRYEEQGLEPDEFGVRIRTHPVLRITAKMGAAVPAYASFGGRRVQTRYFPEHNSAWLQDNVDASDTLIKAIRAAGGQVEALEGGGTLFRSVDVDLIKTFIGNYQVHPDSADLDRTLVLKYIEKQEQADALKLWSVAIMAAPAADHGIVRLGGLDFGRIERSKLTGTGPERADIKTLMSKDHRVIDLALTTKEARAVNETKLMEARNSDAVAKDQGLLLLYPIDPGSAPEESNKLTRSRLTAVADVIGLAMVFPGNAKGSVRNEYMTVDLSAVVLEVEEAELASLSGDEDQ